MTKQLPVVSVEATARGEKAPFGGSVQFDVTPGRCIWLQGASGRGKTTIAMYTAGLVSESVLQHLQLELRVTWDENIDKSERIGVLFQQTTLLDELTLAGNLQLALMHAKNASNTDTKEDDAERSGSYVAMKHLLETVGLDWSRDAHKRPTQLSGGMARRAALAVLLAQRKRVIVLDEPFTGLDRASAVAVAQTVRSIRKTCGIVLIAHEPELAELVATPEDSQIVQLQEPKLTASPNEKLNFSRNADSSALTYGIQFYQRCWQRFVDYFFWSCPLVLTAFLASSMAIAMLSADTLQSIDVSSYVMSVVNEHVPSMIELLTGAPPNALHMMGVRMKVKSMLNETLPSAKASLFAIGMTKLWVLELGPLLTALLLAGRMGGSYAGQVATLHATAQAKWLQVLGLNVRLEWTLLPGLIAGMIAGPVLTIGGTVLALVVTGYIGRSYGIVEDSLQEFQETVWKTTFPPEVDAVWLKYPPVFHMAKALVYTFLILGVAEGCSSWYCREGLTHRHVPRVITASVVCGSLLVIFADWGFSRLWLIL